MNGAGAAVGERVAGGAWTAGGAAAGGEPAIELAGLTYRYPGRERPALAGIDLTVAAGERLLLAGPSGAGKSTLLRCLNGLVPHFHGGVLGGRVRVAGRDPVAVAPRGMSDVVGLVFQDPERQFVTQRVEDEVAFAMENHDLPRGVMGERIAEALRRLGIAHLRERRVDTLSGGERQRVAIAAVLALRPAILALDEPTSQLDPAAAGEVLELLAALNRDLGLTVIVCEHRLERVAGWAERVCLLDGEPGAVRSLVVGAPAAVLAGSDLAPPVARLARAVGFAPAPLTAAEAGPLAAALAARLARVAASGRAGEGGTGGGRGRDRATVSDGEAGEVAAKEIPEAVAGSGTARIRNGRRAAAEPDGEPVCAADGVRVRYGSIDALRGVDFSVSPGERVALVGVNGAGKSTLLKVLVGLVRPDRGSVRVLGRDVATLDLTEVTRDVGLVPQYPARLLFSDTVADELAFTRRAHGVSDHPPTPPPPAPGADDPASPDPLLARLGLAHLAGTSPHDLSGGERQRAAIAAILAAGPRVLLLDEPTRGLDPAAKESLAGLLDELAAGGTAVVVATHDVELAARFAARMVLLEGGRVAADGTVAEVMARFPAFASEVARIFAAAPATPPSPGTAGLLTVEDVVERLGDG